MKTQASEVNTVTKLQKLLGLLGLKIKVAAQSVWWMKLELKESGKNVNKLRQVVVRTGGGLFTLDLHLFCNSGITPQNTSPSLSVDLTTYSSK